MQHKQGKKNQYILSLMQLKLNITTWAACCRRRDEKMAIKHEVHEQTQQQECTNISKSQQPRQNFRRQTNDIKQVPQGGNASIWRHSKKKIRRYGDLSSGICTSLPKRVAEPEEACVLTILSVDRKVVSVSRMFISIQTFCQFRTFLHTQYQIKFGSLNTAVYCFCLQRF